MKKLFHTFLWLAVLTSCSDNDVNPVPGPQDDRLLRRENYYYLKQADGQWIKQPDFMEFNFKYSAAGRLTSIESDKPGINARWFSLIYEQGKFTGIDHRFLKWWFTFGDGRLRSLRFEHPGGPTGSVQNLTSLYYRTDGKLDSIVGKQLDDPYTINQRHKTVLTWQGDDLVREETYGIDHDVATLKNTVNYEYENRPLLIDYAKYPEGMGFFIMQHIFQSEWFYYSKRLIKTVTGTSHSSNTRSVSSFVHVVDVKGRLVSTERRNVSYDKDNNPSNETRTFSAFSYGR